MKEIALAILPLAMAVPAMAQHVSSCDTLSLGEVTVTAVKQAGDDIKRSPSATFIDRTSVERNGVVGFKSGAALVPNLFVPDYGSRITSTIYMRGIGARIDQPSVGLTIDNMPVMSKENYDMDLMDIARVEVLRGPQSAMFGRNTMGGVINIYTLSPLSYQGTRALLEAGSHGLWRAGVSHYNKVNDRLGIAGSLSMNSNEGEFRNEHNGRRADWERQGNARVRLAWAPRTTTLLSNTLNVTVGHQGGYPYERVETGKIAYNDTCFYRRTSVTDALSLATEVGKLHLDAWASYQMIDDNMTLDQDFTPLPYFTLTQARTEHAATLDAMVRPSKATGKYKWSTGVSAFYRHLSMNAPVTFYDTGIAELIEKNINQALPDYPVAWSERSFVLGSKFTMPTWGVALYHSSMYSIDKVDLKASLRIDYENASLDYRSTTHTSYDIMHDGAVYAHMPIDIDDKGHLNKGYFNVLPSLTATWRIDDRNTLHAIVSRGSKAGGYNTQMFSDVLQQRLMSMMGAGPAYNARDIVTYKPESAWNMELGTHLATADGRLTANLNAFMTLCSDLQLTVFPKGNTTGRMMTNAGRSRNMGVEAALAWQPRANTGVNVTYGWTNAKFVEYNDGKNDYKDNILPYAPAHTLHASAYNRWDVNGLGDWLQSITVSANVSGAGRIYWNEANSLSQPFYALLGSELTLDGRHYSLQLWGRNLTGTEYKTFYFVSMSRAFLQRGHGRSLGATLRLKF